MPVSGKGGKRGLSPWVKSSFVLRKRTALGSDNTAQRTMMLDWYFEQVVITGALAVTIASGAMDSSGSVLNPITGTWSSSLGSDTLAATGSMMQPASGGVDRRRRD